jgi:IMP cyclohydrolase
VADLTTVLADNPYPGRGLVLAGLVDGTPAIAYFLTGRSSTSRARDLHVERDGTLTVRAVGDSHHDDLRHYVAAVRVGGWSVTGNGSQVPAIADDLAAGVGFGDALARHQYEPDPPIHTPRIVLAHCANEQVARFGSALRAQHVDSAYWATFQVPLPAAGAGYMLTTYASGPEPIPQRRLLDAPLSAVDINEFAGLLWSAMPPVLRVALAVRRLADQEWLTRTQPNAD